LIRAILRTCLRHRVVVLVLAVLAMVVGIDVAGTTRIDAFPEFAPPRVEIQTEAPGLSSIEVETLVTRPLEESLTGLPLSTDLRSKSVLGLSSVIVLFEPGTDPFRARQLVQERMTLAAPRLPTLARAPVILSPTSSTSRILKIGLRSDAMSLLDLSDLARWTIRPRLMGIPGVANVAVWGERRRELQVLVDPDRLRAAGVGLPDIVRAAQAAVSPSSGGFVDGPNQRLAVTHVAAVSDAEALARAPVVFRGGAELRLADVADVTEGHPPLIGDAVIDGGPGLLLIVEKQPWGNTLEITRAIDAALDELRPALPGVEVDATIFRPAGFIERAVANLRQALAIGCVLVVLVLVVFLWDWRTALVSLTAIPLSLLAAVAVLDRIGATLDTMVLAGLSIALGEVVDDAIIDVENIHRRLRENIELGRPRSSFRVVLDAAFEVRSAVVHASLIVVLVFLPVYLLPGLSGAFFRPLALAYVLAIGSSLAVALTLTPALSMVLLPRARSSDRPSPVATALMRPFGAMLRGTLHHPRVVLALSIVVVAAGAVGFARLGAGFLPDFREQDFLMHWIAKPGASVEALRRTTERVETELLAIPGVRNAGAHLGRAEVADEVVGPNFGEVWVSVDPAVDHATTMHAIEATLAPYPGIYHDVQTYLRERVDEVLTGSHGSLVVRVYGTDLAVLESKAQELAQQLRAIPGAHDVAVEMLTAVPQIEVRPRPEAAAVFGLSTADIRGQITTLVQGTRVGEVIVDLAPVGVVVWGTTAVRDDVDALRRLRLQAPDGAEVRLADVADVEIVATPNAILHEDGARRIDVSCGVQGRALGEVAADVEAAMAAVTFPPGHHAELLGEHAARQDAAQILLVGGSLSVLGILLVLYAEFRSVRLTALVAASLPFALVGAVAAAHTADGVLSLGSLVGFVTVLGIAARNGIMLVSHYRHLQIVEAMEFGPALVVRGTLERLAPILMTALSTGLALVPLVVLGNRPGQEIEHPMAVVILGGLVTSTLLNLLVTPAVYLAWCRTTGGDRAREDEEDG
jgi:CzcA family heavy metal efflux pump